MEAKPNIARKSVASRKLVVRWNSGRRTKKVPRTAHGMNHGHRPGGVELLPETADMHVDHVGPFIEPIVPDRLEEHRAADYLALVAHQVLEQPVLARQQSYGPPGAGDFALEQVELQRTCAIF